MIPSGQTAFVHRAIFRREEIRRLELKQMFDDIKSVQRLRRDGDKSCVIEADTISV